MPRRNKNKNFSKKNFNGNNYEQNNNKGSNNHKWANKNRYNRKIVLKPSQIDFIGDSRSNEEASLNKNRKRVVENLKEMGLANTKLSIGDTDTKKALLESRPYCKISSVPDDVFNLIVNYVQNYFNCYDSNREGLLSAYNSRVTFSVCLNMSSHYSNRSFRFDDAYYRDNRNLKRLVGKETYHEEKRYKLLHHGRIDAVNFISKLPPTEHDPNSFKFDSCYFSSNMISFSLSGVFKEGKASDKVRPLRSFYRSFVCVPDPEIKMTIINDQYVISNITNHQYKKFFQQNSKSDNSSAQSSSEPSSSNNNNENEQARMIQRFSTDSRLNLEWSKYCLDHANWDYAKAAELFVQFKESIPKDAFLV